MKILAKLMTAAAAVALAGSASAAGNLLVNGNFENSGFGGTSGYYNVGPGGADHAVPADFGWSVPVNNVDIVANGVYGPNLAGGGNYSLDLVGYGATGAISQSINTVAGAKYTVTLDYSSNNGISNPTANVSFNGATIGALTGTHAWQSFSTTFTGTGSPAAFAITENYGSGNAGVFLDNISVTGGSVPEPAAWILMLVGFAGLGAALRSQPRLATVKARYVKRD